MRCRRQAAGACFPYPGGDRASTPRGARAPRPARRMSLTLEGDLDADAIETLGRGAGFVSGLDVEILRVERDSTDGALLRVEHHRGYRRVGRGPHSPFTGVADEHRMRAFIAL